MNNKRQLNAWPLVGIRPLHVLSVKTKKGDGRMKTRVRPYRSSKQPSHETLELAPAGPCTPRGAEQLMGNGEGEGM